jgi:hypothetical protein
MHTTLTCFCMSVPLTAAFCHRFVNYLNAADAVSAKQRLHGARLPSGHKLHVTLQTPRTVNSAATSGTNANINTHNHLIAVTSNVVTAQQQQQPTMATTQAPAGALSLHTVMSFPEQRHECERFFCMQ